MGNHSVRTWGVVLAALAAACGGAGTSDRAPSPAPQPSPAAATQAPSGFGSHHHPITTTSVDAQRFFDEGCALVFGFNHEEAVRSFQNAASADPTAAMPHWGIAWALGPNYNLDIDDPRARQASEAMARAQALSAGASPAEREYIRVMADRFSPDPKVDRVALARRYSEAMRALARQYPDDLDAATLYAESLMNLRPWKLWTLGGTPEQGT